MNTIGREGRSCLLVIDMQVTVMATCFDAEGVLARTATRIDRARAAGTPVVFVYHQSPVLVPDTPGWQMAEPVRPRGDEPRVRKCYRDAFMDTTLTTVLGTFDPSRLIITGAKSDYCVRATMQRAIAEGYDVTLASDCHTTQDTEYQGVKIGGEQLVAHTNLYMSTLTAPEQVFRVVTHDQVEF